MTAPTPPPVPTNQSASIPAPVTSGLAITSLICGLLGFLCLPAIAGLICGIIATGEIRKSGGRRTGTGLATAGIILSSIFLCLNILAVPTAMLLPALAKAKAKAQSIASMNNLRQICLAAHLYADEHKGRLPEAEDWSDALSKYVGNPTVFQKSGDRNGARSNYGFNSQVAGKMLADVNKTTVLFFELAQGGWNTTGGPDLSRPATRLSPTAFGFADGHVEVVSTSRIAQLRWEP